MESTLTGEPVGGAADAGWAELMRLAAAFPLERFGGGSAASTAAPALSISLLPQQRAVSYEAAVDLVDGAGDGPLIGLCTGFPVASFR